MLANPHHHRKRRGPNHEFSMRQQRKLEGRLSGDGFQRVYFQTHKHGNRLARLRVVPEARGKAVAGGRRKAQRRGEFCGRDEKGTATPSEFRPQDPRGSTGSPRGTCEPYSYSCNYH